jgi:hypothetical protein
MMKIPGTSVVAAAAMTAVVLVGVHVESSVAAGDSVLRHPAKASTHVVAKSPSDLGFGVGAPESGRALPLRAAASTSTALTFVAGRPRQVITGGIALWSTEVPRGRYNVSFKAVIRPTQPSSGDPGEIICAALDLATLDHSTPWVYTADSGAAFGSIPVAMSGAATIPVRSTARPGLLCASPQGDFRLLNQIAVTYTRIKSRHVSSATRIASSRNDRKAAAKLFLR